MKFSKPAKAKQQLITLLEPRRLMSLTGGVDYTPAPDTAPTQITHTFGYEHALSNNYGDAHPAMPTFADFGGPHADFDSMDAHFARAIAQGSPIFLGDPNAQDGPDLSDASSHVAPVNEFTSMYSSLNHSTVIAIDNATPTATSATLSAANDTTFQASVSPSAAATSSVTTTAAINQDLVVATAATSTAAASASVDSSIAPAVTLPTAALAINSTAIAPDAEMAAPSHFTLENVEQEFLTVSNLASEMISQLGRDIAIGLSHLESNLGLDSINGQFAAHLDGWRSAAAVTGAAIATIVYIQSEADREKPKVMSMFSSRLIEAIPS